MALTSNALPNQMHPGLLDRRVTLCYALTEADALGQMVRTWVEDGDVWAAWAPQAGREVQAAAQLQSHAVGILRTRYRDDITSNWRVLMDDQVFEIVAPPIAIGRRNYLDLVLRGIGQTAEDTMSSFIASLVGYATSTNASGTTTITPTARRLTHKETTTLSGSGSTTRLMVLAVTPTPPAGATLVHRLLVPATADITVEWRNATAGGTLLTSAVSDGSGDDMVAEFTFNGTAWEFTRFQQPANA